MRSTIWLLACAMAVAGCQAETRGAEPSPTETAGPKAVPQPPADEGNPQVNANESDTNDCGSDKVARWLNVLPTETVEAEIREAIGHDRIRYIAPGDMVTMDFRPDRLNVETGEDGRIKLFRCG